MGFHVASVHSTFDDVAITLCERTFRRVEIYTRGALRTGVTLDELKEILLPSTVAPLQAGNLSLPLAGHFRRTKGKIEGTNTGLVWL